MESFGERLRLAREKLNLTVEQVSRDTHIAKRYVEGLEREDFSGFPGETYTLGFLRNYATFLSLNPDEMVALYRNLMIQEQPIPMTELLETRGRGVNPRVVLFVALGVLVAAGAGYGIWRLIAALADRPVRSAVQGQGTAQEASGAVFVLREPTAVRWFSQGDRITVVFGALEVPVRVARIDTEVYLELPGGVSILQVGDRERLDLNGDQAVDLQIQLNSLDTTAGQRKANIGLYKIGRSDDTPEGTPAPVVASPAAPQPGAPPVAAAAVDTAADTATDTATDGVAAPVRELTKPVVSLQVADAPGPFSIAVSFRERCLFRFQVDEADRQTRLFLKGGVFELVAERSLKLWVSNAGVADVRVAGRALALGRPGEVASVDIHWDQDAETGKHRLRAFPAF